MKDKRKHPRSRVLRRGNIVFRNGHSAVGCVVLDLSTGGARLKVREWLGLPEAFELRIENGPARQVAVRYRNMETTGVEFADAA
jgi:hypothetical protein